MAWICINPIFIQKGLDMKGVNMCRAMEEMRNETRLEQKKKYALKMLMAGKLSYEEIADYLEFPLSEVEELANELSRLATV